MEKPVAGVHELVNCELEALGRLDARRCLHVLGRRQVLQTRPEGSFEGSAQRFERRLVGLNDDLQASNAARTGATANGKRSVTNASRRRARSVAG